MEQDADEPVFSAVAGCLFEISLHARAGAAPWQVDPGAEVTLLGEVVRGDRHHFRFRAEAPAAVAGEVHLRFRSMTAEQAVVMREVVVGVAPEQVAFEAEV